MYRRALARLLLVRPLTAAMGRRNIYRFSEFLIGESRRDQTQDMDSNGERMVQATVLRGLDRAIVFDVGANVGDWTANLLELASDAKTSVTIHAFEPCASTFQLLRERIRREQWTNVIPVPTGCAAAPGTATMLVKFDGCSGNAIFESSDERTLMMEYSAEPREVLLQTAYPETVELTSVDAYCAGRSIDYIVFLKCDAEGRDFDVILGAKEMLKRQAIGVVQFEYNRRWIGSRHYLRDVFNIINPLGYSIGKITPHGVEFYPRWEWEMETYQGPNYLACTQEWLPRFTRLTPTWLMDG